MQRFPLSIPSSVSLGALPRRAALTVALLAGFLLPSLPMNDTQATTSAAPGNLAASAAWLRDQQLPEGGFAGFGGEADPSFTALAIEALAAAGADDPANARSIGMAAEWLASTITEYAAQGPGSAAIAAGAAGAAGLDPTSFGGVDLVAAMQQPIPESDAAAPGMMGNDINDHAMIMLGMLAAGQPVDPAMLDGLIARQTDDGGWSFDGQTGPDLMDSNTTALVIEALVAGGRGDDPAIDTAFAALKRFRSADGGFAYQLTEPLTADANSTALVLQALIAAGEDPAGEEWGDVPGSLVAFFQPDGSFLFMAGDPEPSLYAALQAIPALAGMPFPMTTLCTDSEAVQGGCASPVAGA